MSGVVSTAVALGIVYGLVGAAVSIVASATRTLHLAVGPVLVAGVIAHRVLGAFGIPAPVAVVVAVALGAVLSAALEPLVLRPLRDALARLVGLAVAAAVLEAAVARAFGSHSVAESALLPRLDPMVAALVVGGPLVVVLAAAVQHTAWGRRLRLVGGSPAAAARAGVEPALVRGGALAVAGAVAVVAGLLVAPIVFVGGGQGPGLTLRAVAAALLLGRRAPLWAVPGGLLLGAAEALALRAAPVHWSEVAVGALVVLALALRGHDEQRSWGRPW